MGQLSQIAMPFVGDDSASFENYVAGTNTECVAALKAVCDGGARSAIHVHGGKSSGKTHLLVAAYRRCLVSGVDAVYLPLAARWLAPDTVIGLTAPPLVLADDIDALADRPGLGGPLLALWESVAQLGGSWVSAGRSPPAGLDGALPDLVSRLSLSTVYQLEPLSDEERTVVLRQRAMARGLELTEPVLRFATTRKSRDLADLLAWLERIDRASLEQQRRITIPFLKEMGLD